MLKVAICDDEQTYCDEISHLLEKYAAQNDIYDLQTDCYCVPLDLEQAIERGAEYDIFLLDIYMPGITGMTIAQEFRRAGIKTPIIFLTTSKDHALEAFGVNATQYLLKPIKKDEFFSAMSLAMEKLDVSPRCLLMLKTAEGYHSVEAREILYTEAHDKLQDIFLTDGTKLTVRMTMTALFEQLSQAPEFTRCGISYILNLDHIQTLDTKNVKMKNGAVIRIPRRAYTSLKERYFTHFYKRS